MDAEKDGAGVRKNEYVANFRLNFPLSLGQRLALVLGAKLSVDIVAVSPRSVSTMKLQAALRVHRNGKA